MAAKWNLGCDAMNELAKVLPIPLNCRELNINIAVDSVPTLVTECLLTDEETKAIQHIITTYDITLRNSDGLGQQRDMETTDRADSESTRLDGDGQPEIPGGSNS